MSYANRVEEFPSNRIKHSGNYEKRVVRVLLLCKENAFWDKSCDKFPLIVIENLFISLGSHLSIVKWYFTQSRLVKEAL